MSKKRGSKVCFAKEADEEEESEDGGREGFL
jgi:hypothetical protein